MLFIQVHKCLHLKIVSESYGISKTFVTYIFFSGLWRNDFKFVVWDFTYTNMIVDRLKKLVAKNWPNVADEIKVWNACSL
jgi:hypothetical protein